MAVSNYTPNKCKYRIDELDNVVYIVNKESIGGIKVDDGEAYINGVGYYNAINCLSVSLSESESLDERYEFLHTVNFSVTGYLHWYELNDYYVMLKDKSNTYWLVNPYFKIKYTYTYTLDATSNHTDYVVSTKSNYPLLRVKNFNADNVKPCKTYDYCGVDVMAINETRYSKYVESFDASLEQYVGRVKYTNDGFKIVNYKKNTCVFTETFDGNNISHSVKFQVNFDDYKASWHYNLLEFTDNKYAVILSTKCGKKVATGFGYGLQPSYTVTADDNQAINNIEIQLSDLHDNGNLLKMPDELPFEHDSATTWNNVEGEYSCIDSTTAVYTLRQKFDIFGNPKDEYMCLEGFEDRYTSYNIVGTFSDEESFYCPQCRAEECTLNTSLPSNLSFYTIGCKTFSIRSSSDFTIESNTPYITVSPSAGTANQSYSVTVCNSQTPTSTAYIYLLTVTYCSGQTKDYSVTVTEAPVIDCLPQGNEYNISVYAQDVTIPTNCCIQSVSASCCISNIQIQNGYVKFRIDANDSGAERTITVIFTKCDNTTVTATITQAHYYSRWVYEGSQCNGEEWCALDRMYSGETPDNINTPTYVIRYRDCRASSACATPIYKWENMDATTDFYCNDCPIQYKWENMNPSTDFYCNNCEIVPQYRWINLDPTVDYYCSGTTKYYKQQQQISTDGGNVWENVSPAQYRRGESAQTQSSDCGYIPTIEYRWIDLDPSVDYYCSGTTKYYKEKKQYSVDSGVTWIDVTPAEYQWGASAETESTDCGYVPPTPEPMYEWRRITPVSGDSSTFICDTCCVSQYRWIDLDPTVDYYCSGTTKYYKQQKQVSTDCGESWDWVSPAEYQWGASAQSWSTDCGYVPMQRTTSGTPYCSGETGYDKYVDVYSQVSYDGGSTWQTTATTPTLVEAQSTDCGYVEPLKFSATYSGGETYSAACNGDSVLSREELNQSRYVAMTSTEIGDCVTTIGYGTFSGGSLTTALTSVTIPDSVATISGYAFYNNTKLERINSDTDGVYNIPNSVTQIYQAVFTHNVKLTSINLSSGLTSIGDNAFTDCTSLTSITIPNSVTNLGEHVFQGCSGLTSVSIGTSVTRIGDDCFLSCISLPSITIPDNVTTIGDWAFKNCSGLTSIDIPNSVTSIGAQAFSYCSGLTSVSIGSGVIRIGNYSFSACTSLPSITIPNNVEEIGWGAFDMCTGMTSVTIGTGVTSILQNAFYRCSGLTSITCLATTPPTLENTGSIYYPSYSEFGYTNNCPIYVPCESLEAYNRDAGWKTYASRIQPIPNSCQPIYRTTSGNPYCSGETGYDKYVDVYSQVSYDSGSTWQTTATTPTLVEANSQDCGYVPMQRTTSGTPYCSGASGYDKYVDVYSQVSYDSGSTWQTTATTPTLVEADSEDCGYTPTPTGTKFYATYSDSTSYSAVCDGDSELTKTTTRPSGYQYTAMTSAVIGDCNTSIGYEALYRCSGLTSVTIPDSITSIGDYAFSHCSSLPSITIPDVVTSIGESAFDSCSGLTSVTIPSGVTIIGEGAFYGCTRFTSITILATTPPTIGEGASEFNDTNNCPIYVPSGSVNTYKTATNWSEYASRIQAIP